MVCVAIITLLLLADFVICFMVLICVVLTLVDVVGMLHFWGITIDTLSCVNLVLAVGLCVDYSAHMAHAFIVATGTRVERTQTSLITMGPAITNGGVTTFLALVFLGVSESHVFITFFKVFLLTVVFGLFHGLAFLPAVMSMVGPKKSHPIDIEDGEDHALENKSYSPSSFDNPGLISDKDIQPTYGSNNATTPEVQLRTFKTLRTDF